jgi:predicted RNase H-like nuclease (RuvC/YqgF family)
MSHPHKIEQFISRLSPRLGADVHNEVRAAFGISATVAEKAAAIRSDKRYSADGHHDQVKQMLKSGPLAHHAQIIAKLKKPIEALQAERSTFVIEANRTDPVAEMLRAECRALLRSLPDADRIRLALETKESLIREAIAMAPPQLSGLPADIAQSVFDGLLTERYGVKLENNTHLLEAYEEALIAVEEAGHDIRREANLSDRDFAEVRNAA